MPSRTTWWRHERSRALKYSHIALLLCSLALLPIVPVTPWPGPQTASPGLQIMGLLVLTIGLPFTLLAMTSPLLQAWRAGAHGVATRTGCSRFRTGPRWSRCWPTRG